MERPDEACREWRRVAAAVAAVSAVFVVVMTTLVVASYVRMKVTDPLNSPALTMLRESYARDPNQPGIRESIRELDLLVRQAFFTSRAQVRRGAWLAGAGAVVMLLAVRLLAESRKRDPHPERGVGGSSPARWRSRAFQGAVAGCIAAVAVVVILAVMTGRTPFAAPAPSPSVEPLPDRPAQGVPEPAAVGSAGDTNAVATREWASPPSADELQTQWPGFRGPHGNGIAGAASEVPMDWSGREERGIRWKVKVPAPGFSSPIVWNATLFLTGATEDTREVYAFSAADGTLLWRRELGAIEGSPEEPPEVTEDTGYAAATPVTDGRAVVAIFATGDIAAFDMQGEPMWARNLGVPENHYGHSSSLLLYKDYVLVQLDHFGGSRVLALDVRSGETVWETERDADISWASPILVDTGVRDELILSATPTVSSYDPKRGDLLWSFDCLGGEVAPSPAYAHGRVFAASDFSQAVAIGVSDESLLWSNDSVVLPDVASPVATDRFVLLVGSAGTVSCLDAESGEVVWEHDFDDGFYASPLIVGETFFLLDRSGVAYTVPVASAFEIAATAELGEPCVCTPAVLPGRMYIRAFENLYCIGRDEP